MKKSILQAMICIVVATKKHDIGSKTHLKKSSEDLTIRRPNFVSRLTRFTFGVLRGSRSSPSIHTDVDCRKNSKNSHSGKLDSIDLEQKVGSRSYIENSTNTNTSKLNEMPNKPPFEPNHFHLQTVNENFSHKKSGECLNPKLQHKKTIESSESISLKGDRSGIGPHSISKKLQSARLQTQNVKTPSYSGTLQGNSTCDESCKLKTQNVNIPPSSEIHSNLISRQNLISSHFSIADSFLPSQNEKLKYQPLVPNRTPDQQAKYSTNETRCYQSFIETHSATESSYSKVKSRHLDIHRNSRKSLASRIRLQKRDFHAKQKQNQVSDAKPPKIPPRNYPYRLGSQNSNQVAIKNNDSKESFDRKSINSLYRSDISKNHNSSILQSRKEKRTFGDQSEQDSILISKSHHGDYREKLNTHSKNCSITELQSSSQKSFHSYNRKMSRFNKNTSSDEQKSHENIDGNAFLSLHRNSRGPEFQASEFKNRFRGNLHSNQKTRSDQSFLATNSSSRELPFKFQQYLNFGAKNIRVEKHTSSGNREFSIGENFDMKNALIGGKKHNSWTATSFDDDYLEPIDSVPQYSSNKHDNLRNPHLNLRKPDDDYLEPIDSVLESLSIHQNNLRNPHSNSRKHDDDYLEPIDSVSQYSSNKQNNFPLEFLDSRNLQKSQSQNLSLSIQNPNNENKTIMNAIEHESGSESCDSITYLRRNSPTFNSLNRLQVDTGNPNSPRFFSRNQGKITNRNNLKKNSFGFSEQANMKYSDHNSQYASQNYTSWTDSGKVVCNVQKDHFSESLDRHSTSLIDLEKIRIEDRYNRKTGINDIGCSENSKSKNAPFSEHKNQFLENPRSKSPLYTNVYNGIVFSTSSANESVLKTEKRHSDSYLTKQRCHLLNDRLGHKNGVDSSSNCDVEIRMVDGKRTRNTGDPNRRYGMVFDRAVQEISFHLEDLSLTEMNPQIIENSNQCLDSASHACFSQDHVENIYDLPSEIYDEKICSAFSSSSDMTESEQSRLILQAEKEISEFFQLKRSG